MDFAHADVAVVGAGPAGSVAALVAARGGAQVALVDKADFPRDKACGDLIGPRGVRELSGLGLRWPGSPRVRDLLVVGPTGRVVRLPAFPGRDYADHGIVVPRSGFDATLRAAALQAGATGVRARVRGVEAGPAGRQVLQLDGGRRLTAEVVVAADGARGGLAAAGGLRAPTPGLVAFALRGYLPADVALPVVCLLDRAPGRMFPGYGWLFPGVAGRANVGIGLVVGTAGARGNAAGPGSTPASWRLRALLAGFLTHLERLGLLSAPGAVAGVQGGWLRLGGTGVRPARPGLLLVGDAAGLVNPLQGEGIAPAVCSGRLAAEALLAGPATAHARYQARLAATFGSFFDFAVPVQRGALAHDHLAALVLRGLTLPGVSGALAGPWSLLWNDLLDGASPRPSLAVARALAAGGRGVLAAGGLAAASAPAVSRWLSR